MPPYGPGTGGLSGPVSRLYTDRSDRHDEGGAAVGAGGEGIRLSLSLDHAVIGGFAPQSCLLLPDLREMHRTEYPYQNIGVPGPMRPAAPQHPMALDEVLLAFPELVVAGCHLGHPWHVEVVALLQKHPNFYLITSAWAPKHIPAELWHLANTRGRDRLMWASDFPLLTMQRCAKEGWEAPLKDDARRAYLRHNALSVFKFD